MSKPALHPSAANEIEGAHRWYAARSNHVSDRFLDAVSAALSIATSSPKRSAPYLHGTRRVLLADFPFFVVYLERPKGVYILALAHAKRRPGYWRARVAEV